MGKKPRHNETSLKKTYFASPLDLRYIEVARVAGWMRHFFSPCIDIALIEKSIQSLSP